LADPFEGPLESLDQLQMATGWYENLGDFLEYAGSVRNNSGNDENGVTLSTVHKAKGLELPMILISMMKLMMLNQKMILPPKMRLLLVALSDLVMNNA